MKGRRRTGRTKNNTYGKDRGKSVDLCWNCQRTTWACSYANVAVCVSTAAVLTGWAVQRGPSSLPYHFFKSSTQKPGERTTWLVKYACVGPLQWNNDCSITLVCTRGCVAISCPYKVNVRDVYSWERGRDRNREVIKDPGYVAYTDIIPQWGALCLYLQQFSKCKLKSRNTERAKWLCYDEQRPRASLIGKVYLLCVTFQ